MKLVARAPGKVNLCLFLGAARPDGRHELVTLFESLSLADEITLSVEGSVDRVVCPGMEGPNIVSRALDGLRAHGWDAPPVKVTIYKEIPIAGGMGGGSADAAAMLRLASAAGAVDPGVLSELAVELGADVPSQLAPGLVLGTGAGDEVEEVRPLAPHAFVLVPLPFALSTADVYREADRLRLARDHDDLAGRLDALRAALRPASWPPADLLVNDLEPAALSLRPQIAPALHAVRESGAGHAMLSGSGPTVFGLYHGDRAQALAAAAAAELADRYPDACAAMPVPAGFGDPVAG